MCAPPSSRSSSRDGAGWPVHEHRDYDGHGTGGHASPAVRGAREGRIGFGVWRGRQCRACLREGRRYGAVRKLELELEPAMVARRPRSAQNEKGGEQRQGRAPGAWRGEQRALGTCYRGVGTQPRGKERRWLLRMAGTSRARVLLSVISLSTWRAAVWVLWNMILGRIRAELDYGPIVKIVHLGILYNFHLSTMVIRPTD
jgi:hypothetical protein